jgi:hypothetical protein
MTYPFLFPKKTLTMRVQLIVSALLLTMLACAADDGRMASEITRQSTKVSTAQKAFEVESTRLVQLQDSLQINIRKNVDLGMKTELAKSTEESRLDMQSTVVVAAEKNLKLQEEYLALLRRQLQNMQ